MSRVLPRKRFFLGCEGSSEASYARLLNLILEDLGIRVHIEHFDAGGGDPLAIVEASLSQLKRRERLGGAFHSSAIILDGDRFGEVPERDMRARSLAARSRALLIIQDHDFECFLYRHNVGREREEIAWGRGLERVLSVWPDYKKPADARWLYGRIGLQEVRRVGQVQETFGALLDTLGFPE